MRKVLLPILGVMFLLLGACTNQAPESESDIEEWAKITIFEPTTIVNPKSQDVFPYTYPFVIIAPEWTIDWSYNTDDSGLFLFIIYRISGDDNIGIPYIYLLDPQTASGTYHSYSGFGRYYIDVFASDNVEWEITITPIETPTTENTIWVVSEPVTITAPSRVDIYPCTYPFTVLADEWTVDWSYDTSKPDSTPPSFHIYSRGIISAGFGPILSSSGLSANGSSYHSYSGYREYYVDIYAGPDVDEWELTITPLG